MSFFAYVHLARSAEQAPVEFQSIHDISAKIQELKREHEDVTNRIKQAQDRLEQLVEKNKNKPYVVEILKDVDSHFKKIKKLTSERLEREKFLESAANVSEQDIKTIQKSIKKFEQEIKNENMEIMLVHAGGPKDITSIIDAKIQLYKGLIAQGELKKEIERNIQEYKRIQAQQLGNRNKESQELASPVVSGLEDSEEPGLRPRPVVTDLSNNEQ